MIIAPVKDTIKFDFLETISKESFDAIWRLEDHYKSLYYTGIKYTDVHGFNTLGINISGKYMDYLNEIGRSDSAFVGIYHTIKVAGDISPSTFSWFLHHHKEFDFNVFKNRLWATVFLLQMSDPFDEKVERYLRQKKSE